MSDYLDFRYGLLLIMLIGVFSCKSKKELITNTEKKSISDILTHTHSYERYEAKAKIKFSSSEESFKGILNLRIRRDSAILMAIKKIGVEGARTLITQDSVTHIDRINHNYYINHISSLSSNGIDLTYDYTQDILSGMPPIISKDAIIDSSYERKNIIIKTMINGMLHVLNYDIYTGLLTHVKFMDRYKLSGSWTYSDYRLVSDNCYIPYNRIFQINLDNNEKLILELDFNNIDFDIPKEIKINIPDSYNRIY